MKFAMNVFNYYCCFYSRYVRKLLAIAITYHISSFHFPKMRKIKVKVSTKYFIFKMKENINCKIIYKTGSYSNRPSPSSLLIDVQSS